MLGHLLEKYGHYEWSKFFAVSRVPVYIYFIYEAHFYELTSLFSDHLCLSDPKNPNTVDLLG
jgi:hypothetical protein